MSFYLEGGHKKAYKQGGSLHFSLLCILEFWNTWSHFQSGTDALGTLLCYYFIFANFVLSIEHGLFFHIHPPTHKNDVQNALGENKAAFMYLHQDSFLCAVLLFCMCYFTFW